MERILKFEDGKVSLAREELSLIKEFSEILTAKYNRGFTGDTEGKQRLRATRELTFMWFNHSYLSPFREYSKEERRTEALMAADLPETYEFSTAYLIAEKKYLELTETRMLKIIRASEMAVDKIRVYLEHVDFTERNANGLLVNKPSEIIKIIGELDTLAEGLNKLAARQRVEMNESAGSRGDEEEGWIMEDQKTTHGKRNTTDETSEEESEL